MSHDLDLLCPISLFLFVSDQDSSYIFTETLELSLIFSVVIVKYLRLQGTYKALHFSNVGIE